MIKMRPLTTFLSIFIGFLVLTPASAWWDDGHRLVAEIAWDELTEREHSWVDDLLAHHPDPTVRTLADASVWPDLVREHEHPFHTHHRPGWHYEDRAIVDGDGPWGAEISGSLVLQLERQARVLGDLSRSKSDRAVALSWVAHLVGDIHQPLHNAGLYGPEFPKGDRGGNRFHVVLGEKPISLHKLWDSVGGRFLVPVKPSRRHAYRGWFITTYPKSEWGQELKETSPEEWSEEGLQLALEVGYGPLKPDEKIPTDHLQQVLDTSARQVTLAGYRLAETLHRLSQKD